MTALLLLLAYLAAVNGLAFYKMGQDKMFAMKGQGRTPEAYFLLLTVLGGGPGILAGVFLFRHKTLHLKFTVGVPLLIVLEAAVLFAFHQLYLRGALLLLACILGLLLLNIIWFLLTGHDKSHAQKGLSQIPNSVFLFWGLLGCASGIFLGSRYFHHKTTRLQYRLWMPILAVLQTLIVLFLVIHSFL